MNNKITFSALLSIVFLLFCGFVLEIPKKYDRIYIEPSEQRVGDAQLGYDYLINGDYVGSGIPYDLYKNMIPKDTSNVLNREGLNKNIPSEFTVIDHKNGTKIIAPNCMTCHSQKLNGKTIIGLGNNSFDYTFDASGAISKFLAVAVKNRYSTTSKEWDSFESFHKSSKALGNQVLTEVQGINPADKLTAVLVAHRDPETLNWTDEAQLGIPKENIPTDVPPWWILKKKNAMFYTAIGRGDFSRFLMASSLLTLKDTTEANKIDQKFPDVLAWINELEAPKYPNEVNQELVSKGKRIFELNCEQCHGSYGNIEEYPNLLINLEEVGTDPHLSKAYTNGLYSEFITWYEKSWFAKGKNAGKVVVKPGYIAPPLDGIWATAPYLHNGSIPTVEALLNSKLRPKYWRRSFNSNDYDLNSFGWKYEIMESKKDNQTYDTTVKGYLNTGHLFGDDLTQSERTAVIEYLKTI